MNKIYTLLLPIILSSYLFKTTTPPIINLECNTATQINAENYGLAFFDSGTNFMGGYACAGCAIENPNLVIDTSSTTYSVIKSGVDPSNSSTSFISYKKTDGTFPAMHLVGFTISNNDIQSAYDLSRVKVVLKNNGSIISSEPLYHEIENFTDNAISGKFLVQTYSYAPFDEIALEITHKIGGGSLSETRIYDMQITPICFPIQDCTQLDSLETNKYLVSVDYGNSFTFCPNGLVNLQNLFLDNGLSTSLNLSAGCNSYFKFKVLGNDYFPNKSHWSIQFVANNSLSEAELISFFSFRSYVNNLIGLDPSYSGNSLILEKLEPVSANTRRYRISFRLTNSNKGLEVRVTNTSTTNLQMELERIYWDPRGSSEDKLICCTASDHEPSLSKAVNHISCNESGFNLDSIVTNNCPYNTALQWHTVDEFPNQNTLVPNPISVSIGEYYAYCFDDVSICYSRPSEKVIVEEFNCCTQASDFELVSKTACNKNTGIVSVFVSNRMLDGYYAQLINGPDTLLIDSLVSDSNGILFIDGIAYGDWDLIVRNHADTCTIDPVPISFSMFTDGIISSPKFTFNFAEVCPRTSYTLPDNCLDGTIEWFLDKALTQPIDGTLMNVTSPGVYWAICNTESCQSEPVSFEIKIRTNPDPPKNVFASPSTICLGEQSILNATCPNGKPQWFADLNLSSPISEIVQPAQTTTYYAACQYNSCWSEPVAVTVQVNVGQPAPTVNATPAGVRVGESSNLIANCTGGSVHWYADSTKLSPISSPVTLTATTTYYAACGPDNCSPVTPLTVYILDDNFQLRLRLEKDIHQSAMVTIGDTVLFWVSVINQGTLPASQIQVTNYIPNGLTLFDNDWTENNAMATLNQLIPIVNPGDTVKIPIRYIVNQNVGSTILNAAEISSAVGGVNSNSTFDNNPFNDTIPIPGTIPGNVNGTKEIDYDESSLVYCPTGNCSSIRLKRVR